MAEPNYSLDDLPTRAAEAKQAFSAYVADLLAKFEQRRERRTKLNLPVLAFCGYGRAGKDLSAEYLSKHVPNIVYPNSLSRIVLPLIAHMARDSQEHAWEHRHSVRDFWIEACHAVRGSDYTLLLRMSLGVGDVVSGIRGLFELDVVKQTQLADALIWVRNDRVEVDKTVEYGENDCDFTLVNNGSRLELFARVRKLVSLLQKGYFKGNEDGQSQKLGR